MSGHLQADIHPRGRCLDRLYFPSAPFSHSPIGLVAAAFRPPLQPFVSKTPSTADIHPCGRRLDRLHFLSAPFGHSPIVLVAAAFQPPLQPFVSKTPSTADAATSRISGAWGS
jgi:hypothetical protein